MTILPRSQWPPMPKEFAKAFGRGMYEQAGLEIHREKKREGKIMIKPGIYTIESVQKYKDLLLTGKHETGTPEELRARSSREAPHSIGDLLKECVSAKTQYTRQDIAEEALKELESTVEDPAVADTYYNIREQGRALTRLMKQIVAVTGDKVDDVFTYPTHVFMLMAMHHGLPSVQAAIEECHASCKKLAEILNKVLVKNER